MSLISSQRPTAVVVGTTFIDVKGFPFGPLNNRARNLGKVEFCHGGVGRNVAENLGHLGIATSLVSSVTDNAQGREILEALDRIGVKIEHVTLAGEAGMGIWQALLDIDGDVALSVSQMPDLTPMAGYLRLNWEEIFRSAGWVVLEVDLNLEIADLVMGAADRLGLPICGVPGNLDLLLKHPELLKRLDVFICNRVEAEMISGHRADSFDTICAAVESLRRVGPRNCLITLGEDGVVAAGPDLKPTCFPAARAEVVDTTGAGDSFVAGAVFGLVRGWSLERAVRCGIKTAAWTVSSPGSVNPEVKTLAFHDADFRDSERPNDDG